MMTEEKLFGKSNVDLAMEIPVKQEHWEKNKHDEKKEEL